MNKNILGALSLATAASIWGGMYVVSKYVLDYIPPITLVWLRYIIAFIVLYIALKISGRNKKAEYDKRDWLLFIWIGFIGYFVSISFQFIGTKLADAHTGAVITAATPAFIVIFARIFLKEKFNTRKIIALSLSSFGVIIIVGWNVNIDDYLLGGIILVGAALTWALLSVFVKIASARQSILTITTYSIFFALLFTSPLMIWEVQKNELFFNDTLIISGILYLGVISTAVAFFLWNKGMELMEAGNGSIFFFFQPVVGSFLGWLLLNEKLELNFFIGGTMILIGVLIVTIKKR